MANDRNCSPAPQSISSATGRRSPTLPRAKNTYSHWEQLYKKVIAATLSFRQSANHNTHVRSSICTECTGSVVSGKEPQSPEPVDNWSVFDLEHDASFPRRNRGNSDVIPLNLPRNSYEPRLSTGHPIRTRRITSSVNLFDKLRSPGRAAQLDLSDPDKIIGSELAPMDTADLRDNHARHVATIQALRQLEIPRSNCCLIGGACEGEENENASTSPPTDPDASDDDHNDDEGDNDHENNPAAESANTNPQKVQAGPINNSVVNQESFEVDGYLEESHNQETLALLTSQSAPMMLVPEHGLPSSLTLPWGPTIATTNLHHPNPAIVVEAEDDDSVADTLVGSPPLCPVPTASSEGGGQDYEEEQEKQEHEHERDEGENEVVWQFLDPLTERSSYNQTKDEEVEEVETVEPLTQPHVSGKAANARPRPRPKELTIESFPSHVNQHNQRGRQRQRQPRRDSISKRADIYRTGCISLHSTCQPPQTKVPAATRPVFVRNISSFVIRQFPVYDDKVTEGYATSNRLSTCRLVLPAAAVGSRHFGEDSNGTTIPTASRIVIPSTSTTTLGPGTTRVAPTQRRGAVDLSGFGLAVYSMQGALDPPKKMRLVHTIVGTISDWKHRIQYGRKRRWERSEPSCATGAMPTEAMGQSRNIAMVEDYFTGAVTCNQGGGHSVA